MSRRGRGSGGGEIRCVQPSAHAKDVFLWTPKANNFPRAVAASKLPGASQASESNTLAKKFRRVALVLAP